MDQSDLNRYFKECMDGKLWGEWSWRHYGDIDTLVNNEHRIWARQHPDGEWVELKGMAGKP